MEHLCLMILSLLLSVAHSRRDDRTTCKPVTASFCQDVGYTTTAHPSGAVGFNLQQIGQIVGTACSPHIATLMCRVAIPECGSEEDSRMKPCRSLCVKVKADCESALRAKRLSWPTRLQCEALPESNCVQGQEDTPVFQVDTSSCETITVPLCKNLPYNETIMPNMLRHQSQDEARLEIHQFWPLVEVECSPHLKPFLCSLYIPKCVSGKPEPPCRTLCEEARSGCYPLMRQYGFEWPKAFDCPTFTTESCESYGLTSSVCESITIPMCKDLPYNQTIFPNLLGHTSQRQAFTMMSFFNSMVQALCGGDIRVFLCRAYAPQCEGGQALQPCRSFCEKAQKQCGEKMSNFGVSWPNELQCSAFPEENCISQEDKSPKMMNAEDVLALLNAGGYSVQGKSLRLKTARLLLTLMDADNSGNLNAAEYFKLEHYVAVIRREYVESHESRNPPSVKQNQMKKAVAARGFSLDDDTFRVLWEEYCSQDGNDYDNYVSVLTKLQILKDRFQARLLTLPCDCQVASFSLKQFMKSAII
ncbi:uncharacterized protein KZ484_026610 [Pholidichthys leucotaenia]